jgi:hypothetical protein
MINALLATALVAKRMAVSILLLILLSSLYLSSTGSIPTINYSVVNPIMDEVIFSADFEDNDGDNNWTLSSFATDGNWINDVPSPYFTGVTRMEIVAIEGNQSLVTGSINNQDVDGGPTIVRSPTITLDPQAESIDISFSYYFSHFTNSSVDDNLLITVHDASDDNELLSLVEEFGAPSSRDATWELYQGSLLALAGRDIYVQASSRDVANPSKVEAAIDRLEISQRVMTPSVCETLIFDDFEVGFGNWIDGGSDASRFFSSFLASSGIVSVSLRDNTNTSLITSGPHDISDVDQLQVSFNYRALSFENDEDFWFQTSSDGVNFTIEEDWIHQVDFENNEAISESITIDGPFSSTTYFRFRADATSNGDRVFIDDILIETCEIEPSPEVVINIADSSFCNGSSILLQPEIIHPDGVIVNHQWSVLPSSTASGFELSGTSSQDLSISAVDAVLGTIDLRYSIQDDNGFVDSTDVTIFLLGVEPCSIQTSTDSICDGTTLSLDATTIFDVMPDFGIVPRNNSGDGVSLEHEIIGVQVPEGVLVTITLPTWDDHFDEIILNGNQIIPRVFQPESWNNGGMQTERPWLPNINGLPRSIITIQSDEVRYFSSQTVTSTEMVEVFPTNWVTTPQNFRVGTNILHFGIQNTAGPTSGSWIVEAEGVAGYTYLWSTGETTAGIEVTPDETTTYDVVVTAPNGCESFCERTIFVEHPIVSISDTSISVGEIVEIQPVVSGTSGSSPTYQWRLISDDTSGIILSNTNAEILTIDGSSISADGQEQIEILLTSEAGCTDLDTMNVIVEGPTGISCNLQTNFFNEQQFAWGFGIQNTSAEDINSWQARISNASYELDVSQITNNNLFVYTQIDNGDGTYDHIFTGTGGIAAFSSLPNFQWQGVNFGGPISSDGIEFRCKDNDSDLCADMGTVVTEDIVICAGEDIQVQPTIVGDLGPTPSYQWSLISDGSSGLALSNISSDILMLDAISVTETAEELIELVVTNSLGCSAIDTMLVSIGISTESNIDYVGCQGDGYGILVNDTLYDESNPTGVETIPGALGCDSIINVNLIFNEPVVVEAGMLPFSVCSATGEITLSDLGASISGGANTGLWTSMGDGTFDVGGIFNISGSASVYRLGPRDIENGEVILTLTSTDPPGPCEPVADAVLILINDITCSQFPWAGN